METDIGELLRSWPFDSEEPANNYRRIEGSDGRAIIQVREALGIQQMEYEGRPDGLRPNGHATWLDYYQTLAAGEDLFQLAPEDCRRLMQEGVLVYQRYLILFQMSDWDGVVRDTQRNLNYFDFVKAHSRTPEEWMMIGQYRPYVLRMNAVARANLVWNAGRFKAALELLRQTAKALRALDAIPSQVFTVELERSQKHLQELIEEWEKKLPESRLERIKRELKEAVLREDFERAAALRDKIRALGEEYASRN